MRACAFNFVIAGIDAHGKNYSVLIEAGGRFRLTPLYDVISALPYDLNVYNKLAMSVGRERKYEKIFPSHWRAAARDCRYDDDKAVAHVREYIESVPDAAREILKECRKANLPETVIALLAERVAARCRCAPPALRHGGSRRLITGSSSDRE